MEKEKKPSSKAKFEQPRLVRGMKDTLPSDQAYWDWIRTRVFELARDYSFGHITTPVLEQEALFIRSIGEATDIVEKEMFSFADQNEDRLVMRPEATASIVRAYNEHGMVNLPQPVKLFYFGQMFRRERPQAGRYREFNQYGFEVLGDDQPIVDAQLIVMAYNFFKEIGLPVTIQVNSLGNVASRTRYRKELNDYFKPRRNQLCDDCKKRLLVNPLRVLDCKNATCQELAVDAPQIVDFLDEADNKHFTQVLEYLEELEVPYILNSRIIRGLDYYTRTTFEIWPENEADARQSTLGGGGRYDGLAETLGGRPTPAAGFAVGIERVILKLKEAGISAPQIPTPEVYVAQLGDQSRRKAMMLYERLRREGFLVAENFSKEGIKAQLESANRQEISIALILGQKENIDGTILIRDMESGTQEVLNFEKVTNELKRRLRKNGNGLGNGEALSAKS
jgi:histidyl-tRNA synthetase